MFRIFFSCFSAELEPFKLKLAKHKFSIQLAILYISNQNHSTCKAPLYYYSLVFVCIGLGLVKGKAFGPYNTAYKKWLSTVNQKMLGTGFGKKLIKRTTNV